MVKVFNSFIITSGHFCHPIGINLSLNPGFRRGEGGWAGVLGAFMVARCRVLQDVGSPMNGPYPPSHGLMLMSFSKVAAY